MMLIQLLHHIAAFILHEHGEDVSNFLTKPKIVNMKQEVIGFLEHIQLFYVDAATQIKQCFPIDNPIIKSLGFLNPNPQHSKISKHWKVIIAFRTTLHC